MPFESRKQKRFFQAVAHGFKPDRVEGPTRAVARKFIKDSEGEPIRKARGGPVRPGSLLTGRPLPRPGGGDTGGRGGLGATARVGGLGDSTRPRSGLAKRPASNGTGRGSPLPTGGRVPSRGTGNTRPRPGRGSNPVLALAGTNHYQASDRLDTLKKRVRLR